MWVLTCSEAKQTAKEHSINRPCMEVSIFGFLSLCSSAARLRHKNTVILRTSWSWQENSPISASCSFSVSYPNIRYRVWLVFRPITSTSTILCYLRTRSQWVFICRFLYLAQCVTIRCRSSIHSSKFLRASHSCLASRPSQSRIRTFCASNL